MISLPAYGEADVYKAPTMCQPHHKCCFQQFSQLLLVGFTRCWSNLIGEAVSDPWHRWRNTSEILNGCRLGLPGPKWQGQVYARHSLLASPPVLCDEANLLLPFSLHLTIGSHNAKPMNNDIFCSHGLWPRILEPS